MVSLSVATSVYCCKIKTPYSDGVKGCLLEYIERHTLLYFIRGDLFQSDIY